MSDPLTYDEVTRGHTAASSRAEAAKLRAHHARVGSHGAPDAEQHADWHERNARQLDELDAAGAAIDAVPAAAPAGPSKRDRAKRVAQGAGKAAGAGGKAAKRVHDATGKTRVARAAANAAVDQPIARAAGAVRSGGEEFWTVAFGVIGLAMFYNAVSHGPKVAGLINQGADAFHAFVYPDKAAPPVSGSPSHRHPHTQHDETSQYRPGNLDVALTTTPPRGTAPTIITDPNTQTAI